MTESEKYMTEALAEAEKALAAGEVPIGAVMVRNGEIIARGHNLRNTDKNPLRHAEIDVIDAAAKIGAEIYCMDAGWYADGTWWETVGEWQVCESRFPNGIKEVFDYIRKKGMKPGRLRRLCAGCAE